MKQIKKIKLFVLLISIFVAMGPIKSLATKDSDYQPDDHFSTGKGSEGGKGKSIKDDKKDLEKSDKKEKDKEERDKKSKEKKEDPIVTSLFDEDTNIDGWVEQEDSEVFIDQ